MDESRLYELPLSDLCLVCEPPYTEGLRITVIDEAGQHCMFCPEMEVAMYQALFHRYVMYPGTVREMAYDRFCTFRLPTPLVVSLGFVILCIICVVIVYVWYLGGVGMYLGHGFVRAAG